MENKKALKCVVQINDMVCAAVEETFKTSKESGVFTRDQIKLCTVELSSEVLDGYQESFKDEIIEHFIKRTRRELFIGNYEISITYEKNYIIFYGYYKTLIKIKGTLISNRYFFDIYGTPEVSMGANIAKIWKYAPKNYCNDKENLLLTKIPAAELDYLLDDIQIRVEGGETSINPKNAQVEYDKYYTWYGIDDHNDTFVNITKARIKVIYQNASLKKYIANDTRNENWFGLCLNVWINPILYYENWEYMGVDKDFDDLDLLQFILDNTPEEIKQLSDSAIEHRMYNFIQTFIKTKNTPFEVIIEKINNTNDEVKKIQETVDQAQEEIINELYEEFFPNDYAISVLPKDRILKEKKEKLSAWDSHCFDCGFTDFFVYERKDHFQDVYIGFESLPRKELEKLYGGNNICYFCKDGSISLQVPVFNQSLNLQKRQAELICKVVKEKLNLSLSVQQKLD